MTKTLEENIFEISVLEYIDSSINWFKHAHLTEGRVNPPYVRVAPKNRQRMDEGISENHYFKGRLIVISYSSHFVNHLRSLSVIRDRYANDEREGLWNPLHDLSDKLYHSENMGAKDSLVGVLRNHKSHDFSSLIDISQKGLHRETKIKEYDNHYDTEHDPSFYVNSDFLSALHNLNFAEYAGCKTNNWLRIVERWKEQVVSAILERTTAYSNSCFGSLVHNDHLGTKKHVCLAHAPDYKSKHILLDVPDMDPNLSIVVVERDYRHDDGSINRVNGVLTPTKTRILGKNLEVIDTIYDANYLKDLMLVGYDK